MLFLLVGPQEPALETLHLLATEMFPLLYPTDVAKPIRPFAWHAIATDKGATRRQTREAIKTWITQFPRGRVALILTGKGTELGKYEVPTVKDGQTTAMEMNPLKASSEPLHAVWFSTYAHQMCRVYLTPEIFEAIFRMECFGILFPSHPHPDWANTLESSWHGDHEPHYSR